MKRRTVYARQIRHTLFRVRMERGLTQTQVAKTMRTTQSAVSDLERGDYDPHIETLHRWADALGYDVRITLIERNTEEDDGTS